MPHLLIPLIVVSTAVSTGIAIAGAAGAFDPDPIQFPEPPDLLKADPEVARQRHAELVRARARRSSTILSRVSDEEFSPKVGQSTVLG